MSCRTLSSLFKKWWKGKQNTFVADIVLVWKCSTQTDVVHIASCTSIENQRYWSGRIALILASTALVISTMYFRRVLYETDLWVICVISRSFSQEQNGIEPLTIKSIQLQTRSVLAPKNSFVMASLLAAMVQLEAEEASFWNVAYQSEFASIMCDTRLV